MGDLDLHWNADKLLLTKSDSSQWNLCELRIGREGERSLALGPLRQVTHEPADVQSFDACYLPDGRIVFGSSATGQCVPCWHGVENKYVANLFSIHADGSHMRRLTFDQDHDMNPAIDNSGQVIYNRWEYTGMNRLFVRPMMRISWDAAQGFCTWLSEKSGLAIALPSEAQWEYACRAGSDHAHSFGPLGSDFCPHANMADKTFATFGYTGKSLAGHFQVGGDVDLICAEGLAFADRRFDDKACVSSEVGSYRPNAFGLHDMHGNAAEWTATPSGSERIVLGGSFLDRPALCRSANRYAYPPWQKVYNVGFRIATNERGRARPKRRARAREERSV